uniref:Histone H2A/H2B/H3 domain-containing protein n=1 Tax=Panagrolaimus sp. ES5 TaxID=591445 RepID=A0AC34G8C2_9BILA
MAKTRKKKNESDNNSSSSAGPNRIVAKNQNLKRRKAKKTTSFKIYIYRVLKQVHPQKTITTQAMNVMESFVLDIFERLAYEAGRVAYYHHNVTLTTREFQTAVKLVMPGELATYALSESAKAMTKFNES